MHFRIEKKKKKKNKKKKKHFLHFFENFVTIFNYMIFMAERHEVYNLESAVMVKELEFAINRALKFG